MIDGKMKASVDLEITNFKAKAKEAQQEIGRLEKEIIDLRKQKLVDPNNLAEQARLNREIKANSIALKENRIALRESNSEIRSRTTALKQATVAQTQFRNQAGASNSVALEFNRIIQDAPFGIIGIGNNLQQLAGNFSALRASAGGTGAAISGALASIISPANLVLLGISAVTSAFTAYQLGVFDSKEETKEFKSEADLLKESLDNLLGSLSAVNSARLEGTKSAQDEMVELELLNSVLTDTTKSEFERSRVFNLLLDKYPRIIGNMTEEKALAEGLGDAYGVIVGAILERAEATAIEEKLTELLKTRLDLLQQEQSQTSFQNKQFAERNALLAKQAEALAKVNAADTPQSERNQALRDYSDASAALDKLNQEFSLLSIVAGKSSDELGKNQFQIDSLKNRYLDLNQTLISLLDPIKKGSEAGAEGFKMTRDEVGRLIEDLKTFRENYNRIRKETMDTNFFATMTVETGESEFRRNMNLGQLPIPSIDGLRAQIDTLTQLRDALKITDVTGIEKYNVQIGLLQEKLKQLTGDQELVTQTTTITKALSDAFGAMAQQISASLNISNDSLKAFVGTLLTQTPKIIGAIYKTVAANRAAVGENVRLSLKQALANGIVTGTEGAKALGPIGLALLPVFVGGAMALISGAFRKAGVNAPGGGVGSTASRTASNNSAGTSIGGMGQAFNPFGDMQLRTVIRGTNIELLLERVSQERRA